MRIRVLLTAAALTIAVAASAQAGIVTNGNFATGDFTGWSLTGADLSSGDVLVGAPAVPPGAKVPTSLNAAILGPVGIDHLGQTLSTIAGVSYVLSFALQADTGTTPASFFTASIDGAPLFSLATAGGAKDFADYSVAFVATGADTLDFAFENDISFFELTDVAVVTEPSTLALMLAGVTGIGLRRRRGGAAAHS
jgi:hypothetical protein